MISPKTIIAHTFVRKTLIVKLDCLLEKAMNENVYMLAGEIVHAADKLAVCCFFVVASLSLLSFVADFLGLL